LRTAQSKKSDRVREARIPIDDDDDDGDDSDESSESDEWDEIDAEDAQEADDGEEEEDDDDDEEDGDDEESEDDGTNSDEWEEVDPIEKSSKGEEETPPQLIPIDAAAPAASKHRFETTKIFTDEDFEKIKYLREKQAQQSEPSGRKRKHEEIIDQGVDPEDIEGYKKKARRTLEERVESVKAGRDEQRRKFEFGRKRVGGSKTNIEKRKTKNFGMTRVKALTKLRRSGSQKRLVKKKHLSKIKSQRMNKHH